jgi:low affinity Fe/Cu permease
MADVGTGDGPEPEGAAMYHQSFFGRFAQRTARAMGHPLAFVLAVLIIVGWALTGPFFGLSDTWQLVINTSTTIVTFLMVFLIQNTQNRESAAVQLKLDELIRAHQGAHNALLDLEELGEEELDRLRALYEDLAQRARADLQQGLLDTGTPETGTASVEQALSRLVLLDQHGQPLWSATIPTPRGAPQL